MKRDDRDVLVIVDIQNDFCPGGALAVPQGDEIVSAVNRLAAEFTHVVLTQDWHPRGHASFASSHPGRQPFDTIDVAYGEQILWPDHCVQGTRGADFHPDLTVPHAELVLRKGFRTAINSYSAFFENDHRTPTGLVGYLKERRFECIDVMRARHRFLRILFGARRPPGRVRGHGRDRSVPRHRYRRLARIGNALDE